jgi:hypothetical protein
MLKEWQFNVLFIVGVSGAILLLIGPEIGLDVASNPTAVTGVGAILAYVLTQKKTLTKHDDTDDPPDRRDDGSV